MIYLLHMKVALEYDEQVFWCWCKENQWNGKSWAGNLKSYRQLKPHLSGEHNQHFEGDNVMPYECVNKLHWVKTSQAETMQKSIQNL